MSLLTSCHQMSLPYRVHCARLTCQVLKDA